jgi:hypothetical protein
MNGIGNGQHWFDGFGYVMPASDISPNFFTTAAAQGWSIGLL